MEHFNERIMVAWKFIKSDAHIVYRFPFLWRIKKS